MDSKTKAGYHGRDSRRVSDVIFSKQGTKFWKTEIFPVRHKFKESCPTVLQNVVVRLREICKI